MMAPDAARGTGKGSRSRTTSSASPSRPPRSPDRALRSSNAPAGSGADRRPLSGSRGGSAGRRPDLGVAGMVSKSLEFKDLAPTSDASYLRRRSMSDSVAARSGGTASSAGPGEKAATRRASTHAPNSTPGSKSGRGSMAVLVEDMAKRLAAAEMQIHAKDSKIGELKEALQRSQDLSREVLSARRAAKEAVEDMAEQNAKLIQAYMDKKKEFKEVQKGVQHASVAEAEVQRLREENRRLLEANEALRRRATDLEAASRQPASAAEIPQRLKELQERNHRLEQENKALIEERTALLARTVQQDKLEHHRHMGNVAYQAQSFSEALRHYSAAIDTGVAEGPASAVLHSNRAACLLCLGKYLDCIYDCTTSMCLDPSYQRSYQRRAEAYAAVGHFQHAVQDLEELQKMTGRGDMDATIKAFQERGQSSTGVDHYKVLALEAPVTDQDIRLAFKQLALKFHPDKASNAQQKCVAEGLFKLVSDASRALNSAESRASYERSRKP